MDQFLYREANLICDAVYCPFIVVMKYVLWMSRDGEGEKSVVKYWAVYEYHRSERQGSILK